jgi:hypothetical protein
MQISTGFNEELPVEMSEYFFIMVTEDLTDLTAYLRMCRILPKSGVQEER